MTEQTQLAGPVTIYKPDGSVETRPPYTSDELAEIVWTGYRRGARGNPRESG